MRHSSKNFATYEESVYYNSVYKDLQRTKESVKHLDALLLDSSLKSTTLPNFDYNIKVIECGKYKQIYKFNSFYTHKIDGYEKTTNNSINKKNKLNSILKSIDEDNLFKLDTFISKNPSNKEISEKNIIRSKNNMCRLILTNEDIFKTFITLTFSDNIQDIKKANLEFNKFASKVKRVKSDFKYVCVPEFQKNGRIHYHLLTNIDYTDFSLINENINTLSLYHKFQKNQFLLVKSLFHCNNFPFIHINDLSCVFRYQDNKLENTKKTFNYKTKSLKVFKTIKYWNKGFTNVLKVNLLCGDNVAGYMSKYMLKDLDNRLFGHKRYLFSQSLKKPIISYLNTKEELDNFIFVTDLKNSTIRYSNSYKDNFDNIIDFIECVTD